MLAGAEGFEPPLAVLETAGLPLNLRPFLLSSRLFLSVTPYVPALDSSLLNLPV